MRRPVSSQVDEWGCELVSWRLHSRGARRARRSWLRYWRTRVRGFLGALDAECQDIGWGMPHGWTPARPPLTQRWIIRQTLTARNRH